MQIEIDNQTQMINQFINHLTPGKVIDLQLGMKKEVRIKPTVIGLDIGKYLLLKFPNSLHITDYKDVLINGNVAVVRYIVEGEHGECIAFSTTIEHLLSVPERLIFLNYPNKIEKRQLRESQRAKTYLPTQISQHSENNKLLGTLINGYIVDISAKGCLFSFKANSDEAKNGMKKCPVFIGVGLIGQSEPLILRAHVKNNRVENDQVFVGIMFDEQSLKHVSILLNDMAIDAA